MYCLDIQAPTFLIFSNTTPHLLYYSHIPAMVISLLLGLFVYFKSGKSRDLSVKILLSITLLFFLWSVLDLLLWTNIDSNKIIFTWSIINLVEMIITTTTLYFSYVFLEKKDVLLRYKIIIGLILSSFVIFIPTIYNIPGFDFYNCEAEQGPLIYYFYSIELFIFIWLLIYLVKKIFKAQISSRKSIVLLSIGVVCFLASFSGANIIGSITEKWEILQYGLFGMPVFVALLAYLIVRYSAFNIKMLAVQALVFVLFFLIGSQFLFIKNPTNRILTAISLLLVLFFGWWLVRSVKQEIKSREKLAVLAHSLEKANLRLKELDQQKTEFLSIAAHQLRTPLSVIKGYISMILEGDYGKFSGDIEKVLENIEKSNKRLVVLIDLFLDVSRIEQGRTKFDFEKRDLAKLVSDVIEELKQRAIDKNLRIILNLDEVNDAIISMDEEKIRHVIFNFIDNAIKYSEQGEVEVLLEYEYDGITTRIKDSGLGFGRVDQANFFQKFYRGENVKGINVNGTGLGLFVCHKFIEAHHGRIWGHSQGIGKGSEFGFWLPFKQQ